MTPDKINQVLLNLRSMSKDPTWKFTGVEDGQVHYSSDKTGHLIRLGQGTYIALIADGHTRPDPDGQAPRLWHTDKGTYTALSDALDDSPGNG